MANQYSNKVGIPQRMNIFVWKKIDKYLQIFTNVNILVTEKWKLCFWQQSLVKWGNKWKEKIFCYIKYIHISSNMNIIVNMGNNFPFTIIHCLICLLYSKLCTSNCVPKKPLPIQRIVFFVRLDSHLIKIKNTDITHIVIVNNIFIISYLINQFIK